MNFHAEKIERIKYKPDEIKKMIRERDEDFFNYIEFVKNKSVNKSISSSSYNIGVYTIGLSPFPILLSINMVRPQEKIILFFSKKSLAHKELYEEFIKAIGLECELETHTISNETDTAELYNKIEQAISIFKNKRIVIDITGGKKPTIAAGFLGAAILETSNEFELIYVDNETFTENSPQCGQEIITRLINPNEVFRAADKIALKDLFESVQYRAATKIARDSIKKQLEKVEKKFPQYGLSSQLRQINNIIYFADIYSKRIDFNYGEGLKLNEELLNSKEYKALNNLKMAYGTTESIKKSVNQLRKTSLERSKEFNLKIYEAFKDNDEPLLYMAVDRYLGALQYKKIDYQSYILRLVSAVEVAGLVACRGTETVLEKKINFFPGLDRNLKGELHQLRMDRNDLSLTHGFDFVVAQNTSYEKAVFLYICYVFRCNEQYVENIINESLKFRSFEEII